jgi:hypothetical protein
MYVKDVNTKPQALSLCRSVHNDANFVCGEPEGRAGLFGEKG